MKVQRVTAGGALASPSAPGWAQLEPARVPLQPVELAAQPTEYIRQAWKDRPYGEAAEAHVAAAHDGERIYLRVQWQDDERPNHEFQDAVGAVFPTNGSGVLATLGDAQKPLILWLWERGRPEPLRLISRGPGVFRKDGNAALAADGALDGGQWTVVFSGPTPPAGHGQLGLAVWNGSNEERAGLAAVSQQWLPLELQ